MKSLKVDFIAHLQKRFPGLPSLEDLISDNLLSPFKIELKQDVLSQAQAFVKAAFALRQSEAYQTYLSSQIQSRQLIDPGNKSILMSYDFHLSEDGLLKLIEINTNASFLALADSMYSLRKIPQPIHDFSMDEIRENILTELDLFGQ